jgi:PKHD-type hydroxylase
MLLAIETILSRQDLKRVRAEIGDLAFQDGKATAGPAARLVKNNAQAAGKGVDPILDFVRRALDAHPVFQAATQMKHYGPMLISRYDVGQEYGLHVDNAFMGQVRSDLSFTLFLNDPDSYDGGELVLELPAGSQAIKLPAGCLILYPSTSLHYVAPITRGQRLAIVGWVQSHILHTEAREALFDLANVRVTLEANETIDKATKLTLQKAQANLMRLLSS